MLQKIKSMWGRNSIIIRRYQHTDEIGWLRCRVLSFLDTAYFDNVLRNKEHYTHPSIELIAEVNGQIVGLIDVECEEEPEAICSPTVQAGLAGMIWHLAVHPDYRGQGIGTSLLAKAKNEAIGIGIERFEAWTRDDLFVEKWYKNQKFQHISFYYHVYIEDSNEIQNSIESKISGLIPKKIFSHYDKDDEIVSKKNFKRIHKCNRYDLILTDCIDSDRLTQQDI